MKEVLNEIDRRGCRFVDLKVVDLWGRWRHVTLHRESFSERTFEKGVGFDASNLGYAMVSKSDMTLIPDPRTLFFEKVGDEEVASFICDVYNVVDSKYFEYDARTILRKTMQHISDIADDVKLGLEFEFHVFDSVRYVVEPNRIFLELDSPEGFWNSPYQGEYFVGRKKGYHRTTPFDSFMELRNKIVAELENVGVSVKYHHHEVGSSQLEIEANFASALLAADWILLVKHVIRNIAKQMGFLVTFMPKPLYNEAGNGMHIHQFMVKDGKNIFAGNDLYGLSEQALNYVAGLLTHCPAVMAFTNPTTNSYRRLVPGFEAPTSPSFGLANRNAAIRIPAYALEQDEKRIEFRTIDASCNPYLAVSAMILAGIDGIRKKLDPFKKNYHDKPDFDLPATLEQACDALNRDHEFLEGIFPRDLIEYWIKSKKEEHRYVSSIPHPAEFDLYFDV